MVVSANRFVLDPGARVLLADLGSDLAHVLRRAGQPADLLARGPVSLPEEQYFAIWRALVDVVGDPLLPLRIAELLSPEGFDPPMFAALASGDLRQAAARIATYKKLIGPLRLEVDSDESELSVALVFPSPAVPPSLVVTELLFWVALARIGTRHRIEPREVTTPSPPSQVDDYEQYLGVKILEGDRSTITFSAFDAERPFVTANDAMWATFEPELNRRLSQLAGEATTAERVRAVLLELLPGGGASMKAVAGQLALSSRTLQRRLQTESTTFQEVLNRTREALARHYLAQQDLSVSEISFLLGFEDPSSFYRAFQTWTGMTPERARLSIA